MWRGLIMWWWSDIVWVAKFLLYEQAVVVYSEYIKYSIDISFLYIYMFVCVSVRLFVLSNSLWSNVPKYRDAPISACVVDCWLYTIWMCLCLCVSAMVCVVHSWLSVVTSVYQRFDSVYICVCVSAVVCVVVDTGQVICVTSQVFTRQSVCLCQSMSAIWLIYTTRWL